MSVGSTRVYGAAVAIVSGIYSVTSALGGQPDDMPIGASVMLAIGLVVLVHGGVLLTPLAVRLGTVSGPLMILWAAVMLANQLVAGMMSWDGGMVALSALMLASGVIMTRTGRM